MKSNSLRGALAPMMGLAATFIYCSGGARADELPPSSLRVAVFQADATPPLGSPVAYAPARKIEDPLSARGIVLLGAGKPIVLCAVDWIAIGNGGHDAWREKLAQAAGTNSDRVAVHVLHQHDGVRCDFTSEELLAAQALGGRRFDVAFVRQTIVNTAAALRRSLENAQGVTHLGIGEARVEKVASNRRILGPDGKVAIARSSSWRLDPKILPRLNEMAARAGYALSATRVEEALAAPEGVIDPMLRTISFWNGERPIVCLTYYATHPQSYFGKGDVTAEFVGLARAQRENALDGLAHVHFNGAGGNVAAGKYNDGTPETRVVLTQRMADGMRKAWEATKKTPLAAADIEWRVTGVRLPPAPHLDADALRRALTDSSLPEGERFSAASKLAFLSRMQAGHPIELACLRLKNTYVLHMPGELFVEYQLAAQKLRASDTVCMAAYGDCGPGYIGTEVAYAQGGYETQPAVSLVAPQVEHVLMVGIRELLKAPAPPDSKPTARVTATIGKSLTPAKVVTYKTVENGKLPLTLHIFQPADWKAGDKRPVLLTIHGGGWAGGEPSTQYYMADRFAKRGWVGISLKYRLTNKHHPGTTPFDAVKDARSAVRYIRAHATELGIDPDRLVVNGGSAGGHLAAATALFNDVNDSDDDLAVSTRPQLIILFYPVIDTGPQGYGNARVGDDWKKISPVDRVVPGLPPTLVLHGTTDTVTPFAGAKLFHERMIAAGNSCELITGKGGHGYFVYKQEPLDVALAQVDAWLTAQGYLEK